VSARTVATSPAARSSESTIASMCSVITAHFVMARSAALYDALKEELPLQAPYAVCMAYRMRYTMQFNAREAIHLLELRSSPQGHPSYRRIVLEMHRLIAEQAGHRAVASAMTHITTEAPELERLDAERRAQARRGAT